MKYDRSVKQISTLRPKLCNQCNETFTGDGVRVVSWPISEIETTVTIYCITCVTSLELGATG